jgi:ketosteroid isomerase-like protein
LLEAPCWGGSSRPNTAFWRAQFQEGLGGLRATGKAAYTGIDIDLEWAAIWTIRDGKLTRAQGYLSRADAAEAAGLSE